MLRVTNENAHIFTPLKTSLFVLAVITPEQRERITTLANTYKAGEISLQPDGFNERNLEFCLRDSYGKHIVNGLIEPDGRSHT